MACNECGASCKGALCQIHRLEAQHGTLDDESAGEAHDRRKREDDD